MLVVGTALNSVPIEKEVGAMFPESLLGKVKEFTKSLIFAVAILISSKIDLSLWAFNPESLEDSLN